MTVTYFEYPWRGDIFAVELDESEFRNGKIVQLPSGKFVNLIVKEGYFPEVQEIATASVVVARGEFQQTFTGDWKSLIEQINATAAVNSLFSVLLSEEEYVRLRDGGLEQLKEKFSERAWSLLRLEEDTWNGGGPALELLRTGRCP